MVPNQPVVLYKLWYAPEHQNWRVPSRGGERGCDMKGQTGRKVRVTYDTYLREV